MDTYSGRQDAYLREKSFSNTDLPHMLTVSLNYQLPFGPGKRWGNSLTGAAGVITQGWQVAGVGSYTSGDRLGITTANTLPYFNPGLRPNQISSKARSDISMSDFDPNVHQYLLQKHLRICRTIQERISLYYGRGPMQWMSPLLC
jgi:hypothetical protein